MIYFVIAPGGAFADWCQAAIAAIPLPDLAEPPVTADVNTLADLGYLLLRGQAANLIAVSRMPEPSLCDALAATGRPLLLLLEDPAISAAALVEEQGAQPAAAIRQVANSHTAMLGLARAPGALVVRRGDLADDAGLAARIAAHLSPAADPDAAREAAASPALKELAWRALRRREELLGAAEQPDWPSLVARTLSGETIEPTLAATVSATIEPLAAGGALGPHRPVVWPREMFLVADDGRPATGIIDVTGRSRCLLYGPYLRLPVGHWSCSLMFGCDTAAVGLPMIADIIAGGVLNQVNFTIDAAGIFEIEMPFENTGPDNQIEVRLFSGKAAFEGHIAIGRAKLTPLEARRLKVS
jgi:hypothetical protein